jgi:large subunit ribosomal protein L4
MPALTVKKQDGSEVGNVQLAPAVFEAEKNAVLVREVYNAYRANQRQGTHDTKTRGTVRGGGRKPWKQKGTGRARQGSIRSVQWRGGNVAHGPHPRDYSEKVNKKKRQGAFRALLTSKLEAGEIIIVDELDFSASPKTREVVAFRNKLGVQGKVLIVTAKKNDALYRAARNLQGSSKAPTKVQVVEAVSIFDLLVSKTLILTKEALQAFEERLK